MNATDVYVEQVIIGALVLLIAVVLWTGCVPPLSFFGWDPTPSAFVLVGIAYLVGLLYDRIADTLLERIDKRQRLELARRIYQERPWLEDLFPADTYRAAIFENERLDRHYNYLRTRVRLTRSVATLGPAGTVALLVGLAGGEGAAISIAVVGVYLLVAALNLVANADIELPRTDAPAFRRYAELSEPARWWSAYAPALAGLCAFAAVMFAVDVRRWQIALAGIFLTVVATWVWIRITGTLLAFLRDAKKT